MVVAISELRSPAQRGHAVPCDQYDDHIATAISPSA